MQSISIFFNIAKYTGFRWKNADVSRTQRMYHVTHIFLGPSLGKVQLCQFSSFRVCVTNFREGVFLVPHPWADPKWPGLDGCGLRERGENYLLFCSLTNEWKIVSFRVTTFPLFFSRPFLVKLPFLETFSAIY